MKKRGPVFRVSVLAIAFAFLSFASFAQQSLNNESIIKLGKAGLSDDVIVSTINASPGTYDTSADGLIALKAAGVSDKVVSALVTKNSSSDQQPRVSAAVQALAAQDPDDPASPHDPGVYLITCAHDGKQKMTFVDRAGTSREKTANVWGYAFSYGISKAKVKAEIPGIRAAARATNMRPIFYMFFPSASNLGGFGGNDVITSPGQFSLLMLEEKKDHRETAVAKIGLGSASAGTDNKKTVLFSSDRIRNGVYRITLNSDLEAGEYAFIASTGSSGAATNHAVVIYDFGVDLR